MGAVLHAVVLVAAVFAYVAVFTALLLLAAGAARRSSSDREV